MLFQMAEPEQIDQDMKAETQEEPSSGADGYERPECRDYKRNVCRKGSACKYYHPPRSVGDVLDRNTVCHDYQNKRVILALLTDNLSLEMFTLLGH